MSDPVAPSGTTSDPLRRRDPAATHQRWIEHLDRVCTDEQTVAAICAAAGVSVPAFYQ
ncbi:hypothetical protein ETAA1_55820 [Urbifossiella limnaea]|uniref:Uncharacterized protein n=1 Tax=Urbifossiella limnaea TaxID=2528023 RepID=A0A517Y1F5_9BACT|nr:hypothetical protein ETAA1_55820 [Urbifossiella limnaea]